MVMEWLLTCKLKLSPVPALADPVVWMPVSNPPDKGVQGLSKVDSVGKWNERFVKYASQNALTSSTVLNRGRVLDVFGKSEREGDSVSSWMDVLGCAGTLKLRATYLRA